MVYYNEQGGNREKNVKKNVKSQFCCHNYSLTFVELFLKYLGQYTTIPPQNNMNLRFVGSIII